MVDPERGNVYWVGSYLPSAGLSFNSYLIVDESPTLINAGAPVTTDTLVNKIETVLDVRTIEYVVLSNADIANTGGLRRVLEMAPGARVVASSFEAERLGLYGMYIQPLIIEDGDALNIGRTTLQFMSAPFIGSPGSLFVFETGNGILFSGEAFSTTVSRWRIVIDTDITELLQAYYDTRIGDSPSAQDAIARLKSIPVNMIAPGHGPMLRKHIAHYIEALSGGSAQAA